MPKLHPMSKRTFCLAALSTALVLGGGSCVVTRELLHEPTDGEKKAAREKERLESSKLAWDKTSSKLDWSGWSVERGMRLRLGLPREIRVGEVFEVWVEIRPVPAELDPAASLLRVAPWEPGFELSASQGESSFSCEPWSWGRDPRSHSIPYKSHYDVDLLAPGAGVRRFPAQYLIPRNAKGVHPGKANFQLIITRGPEWADVRTWENITTSGGVWQGVARSLQIPKRILPAGTRTHVFDVPTLLHGGTLTYARADSTPLRVTLPTGALLSATFQSTPSGETQPQYGGTFDMRPDENAPGLAFGDAGTAQVSIGYFLPDDTPRGRHTIVWSKDVPFGVPRKD